MNAINSKSDSIDYVMEFNNYYTNYWKMFLPMMNNGVNSITWKPEKILNIANLKELNYKNYKAMLEVGTEDNTYNNRMMIYLINKLLSFKNKEIKIDNI